MLKTSGFIFLILWFSSPPARTKDAHPPTVPSIFDIFRQDARAAKTKELILRIQELFQQGDLSGARVLAERSLQQFPNEAGILNLLGIIEAQQGEYPAAEKAFKRAVLLSPRFINAWLNLGRLYQENQKADSLAPLKAIEVYRRILQAQPENSEAHYQSALLFVLQKQYRESLAHLSQLPTGLQTSSQALATRLAAQVGLNKTTEANSTVEQLLAHPDLSELDVLPIVSTLGEHHRDDLSERLFVEIDRKGTASTGLRQQLALIYERQEKLSQARELLEKSARAPSQLAPLLVDLARIARKQKDFKGALGYLAHARDVEPNNAKISYLYGLVCLDADLLAEAHQAFSRALGSNPNDPLYNYALGLVAAYRSDPLEAIPYLQKYRQLKPSDPRGKLALGVAYFNHHDFDSARQPLREAARSSETAVEAHYHLGSIARQEGRVDEAIGELREVLRATPQFADALAELGQCYLQKKDYQTAQEFLDRAIGVDPSNYLANFSLLFLYSRTKDPREKTQAAHFESIKDKRFERRRAMLRTIEVRPSGM